jgi:competence protein ComEC
MLLSFVLGTALQLQSPHLLDKTVYGTLLSLALMGLCAAGYLRLRGTSGLGAAKGWLVRTCLMACTALIAFGLTGLRAHQIQGQQLQPQLEGQNLRVTGVVAAMPQFHDAGVRFVLDVEQAQLLDQQVAVPPKILLGWY